MRPCVNAHFERLLAHLEAEGASAWQRSEDCDAYRQFIQAYPLQRLVSLTLDEYCVGRGDGESFCWWIERGLQPALGRYMPGTARGHLLYFQRDGRLYKHRHLTDLDDLAALRYTLTIQATVANADPKGDVRWLDDDQEIYRRAGVEPRVTLGDGRKLRLLACYHPADSLPISSSAHVAHFLSVLGCPSADIPANGQPVARMLKLREYYALAQQRIAKLSPLGFMRALYNPALGLAPLKDQSDEDVLEGIATKELPMHVQRPPLNQILFGPPGTGKTYETINAALEILDPVYLADNTHDRPALKTRFDKLAAEGRIRFVTFHQSFSYEDFVEGLRAESDAASGQLRYEVVDGVFKSLCELASAKITQRAEAPVDIGLRRVWKMSLGNTLGSDASIFEECLKGNYVLLGYGAHIDFSGCASRSEVQQRFADGGVQLDGPNDYSLTSVAAFVTKMKPGDLVVVSDGNFKFRAIGEITGDYAFKPHSEYEADYAQVRPVKWLRQYAPSLPHTELLEGQFSQMTLYELRSPTLNREKLQALLGAPFESADGLFEVGQRFGQGYVVRSVGPEVAEFDKPKGGVLPLPLSLVRQLLVYVRSGQLEVEDIRKGRVFEKVAEAELEKYIVNGYQHLFAALVEQLMQPKLATTPDARVLIIDEINRGNVSRIFGELITLIEESKRAGSPEALEVILPYSKKPFSVPNNLYLIGTMNTADRSLAGLDLALRRRFTFREMPPKPELLHGVMVEGVDIGQLLAEMNARIEVLLDRDHRIGHAYFIALKDNEDTRTLAHLAVIFRQKILPLLQEYFFEDWERIQWVLNDHRKAREDRFVLSKGNVSQALFGPGVQLPARAAAWYLNEAAFHRVQAYRGIVSAQAPALSAEAHLQAATAQVVVSEFAADEQST